MMMMMMMTSFDFFVVETQRPSAVDKLGDDARNEFKHMHTAAPGEQQFGVLNDSPSCYLVYTFRSAHSTRAPLGIRSCQTSSG